jgi:metal-responsive CopG/Arc/MetJ family transcriptional regulator
VNVKVPEELADEIDKVLKERRLGYRSRAEFVVEAARQRLIEIGESSGSHPT